MDEKENLHIKKEGSAMEAAIRFQNDDQKMIQEMAAYIKKLKAQPRETAKKEAKEALIRTGITTKDGKLKDSIVSWE